LKWECAIFFIDSTKWTSPVDTIVKDWVTGVNQGKGWDDIMTEFNKKQILVTLRSGKEVESEDNPDNIVDVQLPTPPMQPADGPPPPMVLTPPSQGSMEQDIARPPLQNPIPDRPIFKFWKDMTPEEQHQKRLERTSRKQPTLNPSPPRNPNIQINPPPVLPNPSDLLVPDIGVMFIPWEVEYSTCPFFSTTWKDTQTPNTLWPTDIQLQKDKMFHHAKLCVPESLTKRVLHDFHISSGHLGKRKTKLEIKNRFVFSPNAPVNEHILSIKSTCIICQKCERQYWQAQGPIDYNPVPEKIMSHVCLDVFAMPEVIHNEQRFDCFLLCVDRLSGWIVAKPTRKLGLTAELAANLMLDSCWDPFGIPIRITSDQGAQFIGQWWKTLCSRLGITQCYSQAHWPRANGRAERAGQQLFEVLKKLNETEGINWVHALPRTLLQIHDTVGPTGLSPYQIVFGRHRNALGIPYPPTRSCEDAEAFLDRMLDLDTTIARELNKIHDKSEAHFNKRRSRRSAFNINDKVWLLVPKTLASSHKIEKRWNGPMTVTHRVGESSYILTDSTGHTHDAQLSQLKPYMEESIQYENSMALEFHTPHKPILPPFQVGSIIDHRCDTQNTPEFLVHWANRDIKESTWERAPLFVKNGLLSKIYAYCQDNGITLTIPHLMP
jgi:hypothetical protein